MKHLRIFNALQLSTGAASCKEAKKETEKRSGCLYGEIKWTCVTGKNFSMYEMHGKTTVRDESGGVQVHAVYDTPSAQDKAIHIRVPILRQVSCNAQEAEFQTSGK